jgi:hypothetical protein
MKKRADPTRRSGLGLFLLAIGRPRGFACFGADVNAYLMSLAPLIAFALVSAGLLALRSPRSGAAMFLVWLCQLLAPPVIAHPLCRRWDRADRWALYANILNWAPFLFFILLALVMAVTRAAIQAGAPADATATIGLLVFFGYSLWFQWFVARGALAITRTRAALLLGANLLFGIGLLVILTVFGNGAQELQVDLK